VNLRLAAALIAPEYRLHSGFYLRLGTCFTAFALFTFAFAAGFTCVAAGAIVALAGRIFRAGGAAFAIVTCAFAAVATGFAAGAGGGVTVAGRFSGRADRARRMGQQATATGTCGTLKCGPGYGNFIRRGNALTATGLENQAEAQNQHGQ